MAEFAGEGAVYLIDRRDGKPPHYWIILHEPDRRDRFLAVSFTDADNYLANPDVWAVGTTITKSWSLTKSSVLRIDYTLVKGQGWLDHNNAEYVGICKPEVLIRARCNLCLFEEQLHPGEWRYFDYFRSDWCFECDALKARLK